MGPWGFVGLVIFSFYTYSVYSECPDQKPDDEDPPKPKSERVPSNFQKRGLYLNLKGSNYFESDSIPHADEVWDKSNPEWERSANDDPDVGIEGKGFDAVRPDTLKFARQTVGDFASYYDLDPITRMPSGPSQITIVRQGFKDSRPIIQQRTSDIIKTFPGVKTDRVLNTGL